MAKRGGNKRIVELLQARLAQTSIHEAVKLGILTEVQALLEKGADVDAEDDKGMPALIYAIRSENPEMVRLLLANGADANVAFGPPRVTALHEAVSSRNKQIIQLLIENGADLNAKLVGRLAITPLRMAKMIKANEIVELLQKHGARE